MKSRKTIEVIEMLVWANNQLIRTDEFATQSFKAGICVMIEKLLMESGNYKGYRNLGGEEYNRYYYQNI
jgi:hypothetical protein